MTIIQELGTFHENYLWIKREDLLPFSFGGNKARKAQLFFKEIDQGPFDSVVTYGSGSSNHCRVIANESCKRGVSCYVICPEEASERTFNSQMVELFNAETVTVPVSAVHETIERKIEELKSAGKHPYFIEGGGHGNIGTEAYVQCYKEIRKQEAELGVFFDYIFLASGTGTTQAGLVCGKLLYGDERKIIGISIARKNPRGREIILESIRSYLKNNGAEEQIQESTVFIDGYTSGYGKDDICVSDMINIILRQYGIPLDPVYTGKAFWGMSDYLGKMNIVGKNILFIHTGGTPLFFDALRKSR